MSVVGSWVYFTKTMTSGGTSTGEIDLSNSWGSVYLEVPTMTSNTAIAIQASPISGGTFRRVKHPTINSSTVTTNDYYISSACTNSLVPIPNGLRYIKVETTATVDDGCVFKVYCGN